MRQETYTRGKMFTATVARTSFALTLALCAATAAVATSPAAAFDSEREQNNYRKLGERFLQEQATPEYQARHLETGAENAADLLLRDVEGQGDTFSATMCASGVLLCNRDHRLDDWDQYGDRHPVVFLNRNGAHIEGSVWSSHETVNNGQPVPGVVIETGSVQAPENWYRWAAQILAAHGYVVLTFDVQGQGRSNTFGSGSRTFRGVPAQNEEHFVESLQDALDFMLSSAAAPYEPRDPEAAAAHDSEVAAGDADPHNPLAGLLNPDRIGIAGHSLGASGVSTLQERDERVDAIVAWDNLRSGVTPRVPALGMSADYGLVPTPKGSDPDPEDRNGGFETWRSAGVDAMQVNIRGGSHYEWSYSPSIAFIPPATLRGIDMSAWYTAAWFDRYVKGDETADARLLTDRWHADPVDIAVDPEEDGNMFSFYFRSRYAFTRADGTAVACDDVRTGCSALTSADGEPRDPAYSYLEDRKRGSG